MSGNIHTDSCMPNTNIHTVKLILIYFCLHTYILSIHIPINIHTHMHVWLHTYMHTHVWLIQTGRQSLMPLPLHMHVCTYTYTKIHLFTDIHDFRVLCFRTSVFPEFSEFCFSRNMETWRFHMLETLWMVNCGILYLSRQACIRCMHVLMCVFWKNRNTAIMEILN